MKEKNNKENVFFRYDKQRIKYDLYDGILHFFLPLFMIGIIPLFIRPLSVRLGYKNYDTISGLLEGLFEALIWSGAIVALYFIRGHLQKKKIFREYDDAKELICYKNLIIISLIVISMIALMSFQVGFKVKLFYDLGEKLTGFDFFNRGGELVGRIARCAFIPCVCRGANLISGIFKNKYLRIFIYFSMIFLYGLFDVLYFNVGFTLTYLLFYICFGVIYILTRKNLHKTGFLATIIYIF